MLPTNILASLSGLSLTVGTAGLIFGCIVVTYMLCLGESQCPVFLPMISDTFVPIPGNYISRMVFSAGQFGLGAVMIMDYFSYRMEKPSSGFATKFWLVITLVATVCLGIVGAVCESDTAPTCLANGTLHTSSAVFLYVSLDIYAVSCARTPLPALTPSHLRSLILLAARGSLRVQAPPFDADGAQGAPAAPPPREHCDQGALVV